ncbi:MAG TPA: FYDLN acid domain-containing protein [Thermoanaerobaculia bacterium]|jgi:predicted  nucleic acid-binding Zn-ribbon protein|nr:FYDLN acid domain-containing protein [Thermoanaerobaculia bacterium]
MPDLGKKYECFHCHTKFYNLGKPDPICPKCGANQKNAKADDAPPPAPRPPRRSAMLETIPDENPPEFGEEAPAEPEESDLDDDELEEGDEPREKDDEEEEY